MTTLYKLYDAVSMLTQLHLKAKKLNELPNGALTSTMMKRFITEVEHATWNQLNDVFGGKALEAELIKAKEALDASDNSSKS